MADDIVRRQANTNFSGFSDPEMVILLSDVSEGLSYIHSKDMAHLDIKPQNLLVATR